jgi:hypothetical protein
MSVENASPTHGEDPLVRPRSPLGWLHSSGAVLTKLSRDKAIRTGFICAVSCYLTLQFLFCCYVHYFFGGNYAGPLLISTTFGVPAAEAEAGILPVIYDPIGGWDGQFYYFQSNDPFLLGDAREHIDVPKYRYQRNGVPLVAYAVSRGLGYAVTPPALFFAVQLIFTSLGFGVLSGWLVKQKISRVWALAWLLSMGCIHAMVHGLPDSSADALFIVAMCALLSRRLWTYVICAIMLVLFREAYAIFAATVFALTAGNWVRWPALPQRWLRTAVVGLPGAVLLAWVWYVSLQTGSPLVESANSAAANVPSPYAGEPKPLVGAPFYAFACVLKDDFDKWHRKEIIQKTISAAGLLVVLACAALAARRSPEMLATIPYILLVSMTGWIVWQSWGGYGKAISSAYIVGILLLPMSASKLLRGSLIAATLLGAFCLFHYEVEHQPFMATVDPTAGADAEPIQYDNERNESLDDFRCHVEAVGRPDGYRGVFAWCHRSQATYSVEVKNCSNNTWYCAPPGKDCVCLGWRLESASGRTVDEGRAFLKQRIGPGESANFKVPVSLHAMLGDRKLVFSMVHEGHRWFDHVDARFAAVDAEPLR